MASFEAHCKECKEKLGEEFPHVHKWLDQFFVKFDYDIKHRDIRHHSGGIEEIRKIWGDKAAEAAKLHIATDFYGFIPKDSIEVQEWRTGIVHHPEGTIKVSADGFGVNSSPSLPENFEKKS